MHSNCYWRHYFSNNTAKYVSVRTSQTWINSSYIRVLKAPDKQDEIMGSFGTFLISNSPMPLQISIQSK